MKALRTLWFGLLLALVGCEVQPREPQPSPVPEAPAQAGQKLRVGKLLKTPRALPGRYIVVLEDRHVPRAKAEGVAQELARAHGGQPGRIFRHALRGFSVALPEAAALALSQDPRVRYVEEDTQIGLSATQANAPWGLDRVDQRSLPLDTLYTSNATGAGVNAYIIDSGIRLTHAEFAGRAFAAFDAVGDGKANTDCHGHGTHVAGIVGGTTWGVAKDVTLHSVRVVNCNGWGNVEQILAGLDWVTANHVKPAVANMSLDGVMVQSINDAVTASVQAGVVYVVAAGNGLEDACNSAPMGAPLAITVGATDSTDARAYFSNWGPCVDLFAPGQEITSAWNTSDTDSTALDGTSAAAPHVAGAAALYLQQHPTASPQAVAEVLTAHATFGKVSDAGEGSPDLLLFSHCAATGDTVAPQVTLTAPGAGTVSGQVTLTAQASDDTLVEQVSFLLDGRFIGGDSSAPFELVWDSTQAFNGSGVLTARAVDANCNVSSSAGVTVLIDNPGYAIFSPALGAPVCASLASGCDTGNLVAGRGPLGPELNAPNTLGGTCADGDQGIYRHSTSLERIQVSTLDGGPFTSGKKVRVKAFYLKGYLFDGHLMDIFHAPDATAPVWTQLASIHPFHHENEAQLVERDLILPAGTQLQAIRVAYRYQTGQVCAQYENSGYDDYDDLAFAVSTETDTQPPSIAFTAPTDGANTSGRVDLYVDATDNFAVTHVEFFVNGTLINTRTYAPFYSSWFSYEFPNGTHTVTARAWDLAGNSTIAGPLTIHIDNDLIPPTAAFLAPSDGAAVQGTVTLQVAASDEDGYPGGISYVYFYVDGRFHSYASTFTSTWDTLQVPNGTHVLTARATDNAGNETTASVTVLVDNDLIAPTVSITAPASGATVSDIVQVTANASDNRGVARVDFFANGTLLSSDTTAPYSASWDARAVPHGSGSSLTAKAYDARGLVATHSINVLVHDRTAPTVVITSPAEGARKSGSFSITANATDNQYMSRVEFLDGTKLLGTDYSAPWGISWNTSSVADGAHTLTARAYDQQGNVATSSVNIVLDNNGPAVSFTSPQPHQLLRGVVSFEASATDPSSVTKVEFSTGGVVFHTALSAPYTASWDSRTQPDGTYVLIYAKAWDGLGHTSSAALFVTVDNTGPSVSLTSPAAGTVINQQGTTLTASASDTHAVAKVEFYAGSVLVGTDTSSPYSAMWVPPGKGSYTLTARAYDTAGNVSTSAGVTVQGK